MKFHLKLLMGCLLLSLTAAAQKDMSAIIDAKAKAILPKLIEWRRYIHEHPELSNREVKTGEYIAAHLRSLGIEVHDKVAKTGVLGILKGDKPGPVIAIRADIDALPVEERANIPWKSTVKADYLGQTVPVMHACGHDTHTAILMATAEVLASMKKDLPGTVKFFFQPAEEGAPGNEEGGAPLMIKEGVMENPKVDAVVGLHIAGGLEIGQIRYKPGASMASSDWISIKIKGKQAHGSTPWLGVDPINVGSQIINSLQTIVSRQEDIVKAPVVVTIAKFHSGVRANIIPEEAQLEGTIRTLDPKMQKDVHARIRKMVEKIGEANNATIDLTINTKTLVTYNDSALTYLLAPSLEKAAGKANTALSIWTTGAEDFSFFGENTPTLFFNLGGMPKGGDPSKTGGHHTPDFYVDDSMLDVGVKAFCNIVFDYAAKKSKTSK
ncbi:MAG TPA: amidohydrolase [Flavihumibacter sp.]|nr:amidohydrolase [Flavihumibacter sp.]HQD11067.1 amidohydrolase [Flavihumibacter sp.]